MTSEKWEHLNRPLGYEIATLLAESEMSFTEIKRNLPYESVNDNEVNRILDTQESELEVFIIPKTRGGVKYTLNQELFSDEELKQVRAKAEARIDDNLPRQDQNEPLKSDEDIRHMDAKNMESRFF